MHWQTLFSKIDWQSVIAALALLFSIYTFWKQYRLGKEQAVQQKQLNDLMIAKELVEAQNTKKADVSANLIKVGENNYRVKVLNRGKAEARNVRIEDSASGSYLIEQDVKSKFPLERLEP
jgi:hypothetical protein